MIIVVPLSKVIKQFPNIKYIIYSDDIQLYWEVATCSINVLNKLTLFARNVRKWLIPSNFCPNSSKTKLLNIIIKPFFVLPILLYNYYL